jgi:hypothetical protein
MAANPPDVLDKSRHDGKQGGAGRELIELLLALPEALDSIETELPRAVVAVLMALASHECSDLGELAALIPDEFASHQVHGGALDRLTHPKEVEYDEYFKVGRKSDQPRLRLAYAFLRAVRLVSLNASAGHNLDPAAIADLLKSVRTMSCLLSTLEAARSSDDGFTVWQSDPL